MQIIEEAEGDPRAASELDTAITLLEQALSNDKANPALHRSLVKAYRIQGNYEQAFVYAQTAYRMQPDSLLVRAELARLYELQGEESRALAIKQWLGFSDSQFIKTGTELLLRAQYRDALQWYQRASAEGAPIADSLAYLRYHLLLAEGDDAQASAELRRAIASDREWASPVDRYLAWFHWGRRLNQQALQAEARAALTTAIRLYPPGYHLEYVQSESYRFLALAELSDGSAEQALAHLEMALQFNAQNAWAHVHLGQILAMNNPDHLEQAEQALASALKLQPDNQAIWQRVEAIWRRYGNTEASAALCGQAKRFSHSDFVASYCTTDQVIVQ